MFKYGQMIAYSKSKVPDGLTVISLHPMRPQLSTVRSTRIMAPRQLEISTTAVTPAQVTFTMRQSVLELLTRLLLQAAHNS